MQGNLSNGIDCDSETRGYHAIIEIAQETIAGCNRIQKSLLMVADSIFLFSPVVFALRNSVELEFVMLSVQRWSNNDSSKTPATCTNQIRFIREA
mmetsp:Transcript_32469/g.76408  ORF Transcript_32469/g.76408 Transcript_32469/m.76408 type:complete len:95 (-) Transcript_32469:50-334(-)